MTTVHAKFIGDDAVVPRSEFERLIEIARRIEEIDLRADDTPALGIALLAEQGGAFAWLAEDEDLYSVDDLKVRYR